MLFLADRDDGDDGAVLAQEPDLARPPRRQRRQVSAIAATAKSQTQITYDRTMPSP